MLLITGDAGGVGSRGVLVVWQLAVVLFDLVGASFVAIGLVLTALSFVATFSNSPGRCVL